MQEKQLDWTCWTRLEAEAIWSFSTNTAVLMQYTKRVIYQASCILAQETIRQIEAQSPAD